MLRQRIYDERPGSEHKLKPATQRTTSYSSRFD